MTDNVNQSKGDRDPAQWVPPYSPTRCQFIREWVEVKLRWRLTVDTAEKNALRSRAASCTNATIRVVRAS